MGQYAQDTSVTSEQSRAEIERTLTRYGATAFMYGWSDNKHVVQFAFEGRQIRFLLDLPDRNEKRFTHTEARGLERTPAQAAKEYEQAVKQQWRALALVIKAKLEAVESGISEFESEFLANIVLPDGSTVGDFIRPQIANAYEKGTMPSMLPALGPGPQTKE